MCEHETIEPNGVLYKEDIWWDLYKCPTCNQKFKSCNNHWGLIKYE